MQRKHFALSTERDYCGWIGRFYDFCCDLPKELPAEDKMEKFLTHLAVVRDVSAATQNGAFHAIRFLYTQVIQREIDVAKVPQRESGMTPYEIMLSESQERMLMILKPGSEPEAEAVFRKWGGRTAAELAALRPGGAPTTTPQPPAKAGQPNQREGARTMGALAILQMFGPALAALIPQIANIVKPESEVAKRNVALAETIVNTVVENAGATNMQDAVEKMQSDPALTEAVKKAVVTEPAVMGALQIVEVGGGAKAAAERDVVVQQQEKPFWKTSAVFWVSILLLPMIYWYIGSSVAGGIEIPPDWPWYAQLPLRLLGTAWDAGARVGLANLVIGLVLGGICGVYYGISVTQAKQQGGPANQKEA